ncbi:MAG TPA: Rrf2 family transcriptional regulator [Pseudomonadota bacterium]|nr:Rrf2 family transcriptional regulator [Pseudomonadota bacterium]
MLSQTVGYAVLALGYLAKVQEPTFVRDIATATAIPGPYLAKLINQLARKGLVTTQRGLRGGVTLGRPASEITLMELCEALDEPVVQKRCLLGLAQCSTEQACPAHKFWAKERATILDFFSRTTLTDIARFTRTPRAPKGPGSLVALRTRSAK